MKCLKFGLFLLIVFANYRRTDAGLLDAVGSAIGIDPINNGGRSYLPGIGFNNMGGNGRANNIGGNQLKFLDSNNRVDFDTIQRKLRLGTELSPDEMLAAEKFPVLKQLLDRLKEINRQKELDKMREAEKNGFNNGGINNGFNNNGGNNNGFINGGNNNGFINGGNNNGFNHGANNNGFNNGANNNGFNHGGNINNGANNNNGGFPNFKDKDHGNIGFKEEDTDGDKIKVPVNSKWSKLKKKKFFFQAKPVRPENEMVEEPEVVYYLN